MKSSTLAITITLILTVLATTAAELRAQTQPPLRIVQGDQVALASDHDGIRTQAYRLMIDDVQSGSIRPASEVLKDGVVRMPLPLQLPLGQHVLRIDSIGVVGDEGTVTKGAERTINVVAGSPSMTLNPRFEMTLKISVP